MCRLSSVGLVLVTVCLGVACGPAMAANWTETLEGGLFVYSSVDERRDNVVSINCDFGLTLDHSASTIYVRLGGMETPGAASADFTVDGRKITLESDDIGNIPINACPECRSRFDQLWALLRTGKRLTISYPDGTQGVFSLKGAWRVLPKESCAGVLAE